MVSFLLVYSFFFHKVYLVKLEVPSFSLDKPSNMFSQTTCNVEPSGTPEFSPIAGSEDCVEGATALSNRMHDDADEDDFFSKRRYLF